MDKQKEFRPVKLIKVSTSYRSGQYIGKMVRAGNNFVNQDHSGHRYQEAFGENQSTPVIAFTGSLGTIWLLKN